MAIDLDGITAADIDQAIATTTAILAALHHARAVIGGPDPLDVDIAAKEQQIAVLDQQIADRQTALAALPTPTTPTT